LTVLAPKIENDNGVKLDIHDLLDRGIGKPG
jgi:hypothetical protein